MTEMFGEAWPPMSVPDLAPDDDDDDDDNKGTGLRSLHRFRVVFKNQCHCECVITARINLT